MLSISLKFKDNSKSVKISLAIKSGILKQVFFMRGELNIE